MGELLDTGYVNEQKKVLVKGQRRHGPVQPKDGLMVSVLNLNVWTPILDLLKIHNMTTT